MDLSVIALIGVILLIGIVKKNGIMLVDFALNAERERGLSPRIWIDEACLQRFRPILMTTLAALLGAVPLAIADRTRLRNPQAAGHHHYRRPCRLTNPDALHDAGNLSAPGEFNTLCPQERQGIAAGYIRLTASNLS